MTDPLKLTNTSVHGFSPAGGGISEYHCMIRVSDPLLFFGAQLAAVLEAFHAFAAGRNVLFRRFFLSDPANQTAPLLEALAGAGACPTSVIGQPLLDGTKVAAWVYAVDGSQAADGVWEHNSRTHVWKGMMLSGSEGSEAQMYDLFKEYDSFLGSHGMSVADNCIRTWIFVRDVDTNYGGVVKGRRDYFNAIGLTPDTHFIASTGIGGVNAGAHALVNMDAYAVKGLEAGQVQYLHAYDHLSPTALYGVTFERGTAVTYGDRRHLFISGTASIDPEGRVLHEGDVARQTDRMMENIGALLSEGGAGFKDIACAIVYLRDIADYAVVKARLSAEYPFLDPLYVLAPVCRPTWLVEMECIAIAPASSGFPSF